MDYDPKYDVMPLRGKISPYAWELEHYGRWHFCELTNYGCRKYHRHYDPYKDWDYGVGTTYNRRPYLGHNPSKGYKRKTFRDSRSAY